MGLFRYVLLSLNFVDSYLTFLRSEDVDLYKIQMSKDDAYYIMNEAGKFEKGFHLLDLKKGEQTIKLPYNEHIKRCDRALRDIE